jgi:hypothetical protein
MGQAARGACHWLTGPDCPFARCLGSNVLAVAWAAPPGSTVMPFAVLRLIERGLAGGRGDFLCFHRSSNGSIMGHSNDDHR